MVKAIKGIIKFIVAIAKSIDNGVDFLAGKIDSAVWEVIYAYDRKKPQVKRLFRLALSGLPCYDRDARRSRPARRE